MANILMVTTRLPWPLDDGYALRVFELARHLDPEHNCHLACEPQRTTELAKLDAKHQEAFLNDAFDSSVPVFQNTIKRQPNRSPLWF